jgi:K+-transporting ATPase ATPase A chain
MLIGRFLMIVPDAGASPARWRRRRSCRPRAGTFPTTGLLWVGLLVGVILIVGGLDLLPGARARPDRRALPMIAGQLF